MEQTKLKTFSLDGDTIEVKFRYDANCDVWHGDYPDFIENPRYTPTGRPWVDVTRDDCPYTTSEYGDCGGCLHLCKQDEADLLGVCMNDKLRTIIGNKEANTK